MANWENDSEGLTGRLDLNTLLRKWLWEPKEECGSKRSRNKVALNAQQRKWLWKPKWETDYEHHCVKVALNSLPKECS